MRNIHEGWLMLIIEAKQLGYTHEEARKVFQAIADSQEIKKQEE